MATIIDFDPVRAIINAKIKAYEESLEMQCSAGLCSTLLEKSKPHIYEEAAQFSCLSLNIIMRCTAVPPRLPDDLQVPSVEPRPPNLHAVNLTFAARLVIAVREKFNGNAPEVYTAAKISRQAYSQIVSDETRPVSKRTAVRFAFALHSTPAEATMLLKSAGYAFSNSQTEDFVLQACLEAPKPIWDLDDVNLLLQEYRVDYQY